MVQAIFKYSHLELEAYLNTPNNIELNRLILCTAECIVNYMYKLFHVLDSIKPCFSHHKVLIPKDMSRPLETNELTNSHTTAIYCCNLCPVNIHVVIYISHTKQNSKCDASKAYLFKEFMFSISRNEISFPLLSVIFQRIL